MGKTQRDGHGTPEPNWLEFAVWCFLGVPFVWLIAMIGVLWVIVAMSAIAMHNGSAVGVFSIGIIVLTIPTLAEVLENRPDGKTVLVEIKSGPDSVASICEVIEESRISFDELRIMSFSEDVLHEVKKCQPYVRCLWLVSGDQVDPVKWWKVVKKMVESDFAGIACDHRVASEEFATDVRRLAREFHVWTVNTSKDAALVRRCGARSIITNRPAEMRRIVEATYRFGNLMNSPDGLGCRWGLLAEREQLEEKARENVAKEIGRLHP